jgi:hypothetical protein
VAIKDSRSFLTEISYGTEDSFYIGIEGRISPFPGVEACPDQVRDNRALS